MTRRREDDDIMIWPNSAFPTEASVPVGMPVIDLSDGNKVKQSRYCGYLYSNEVAQKDVVSIPNSSFNPNNDFELTMLFNASSSSYAYSGLFCQGDGPDRVNRGFWIEGTLGGAVGNIIFNNTLGVAISKPVTIFTDNLIKLVVKRVGTLASIYINDLYVDAINLATHGVINSPSLISIGSQYLTRNATVKFYRVKLEQGVASFDLKFDEGSGPIVYDKTNNGFNGIITDGTPFNFWSSGLIPINLI